MVKRGRDEFHEPDFLHYHRYAKRTFFESGMEDKWNKHWRIRGVRSSKPIIRETPHYTASNSPIRDIYDLFPEYL